MIKFNRFVTAAVGTFSSKVNHSILFFPLITFVFLAYANTKWTKAYNFILCSLLIVNISTYWWLSSLYHSKILCCGTVRFVLPIFIEYAVAFGSYSSKLRNPYINPGQSEFEGILIIVSMRRCCISSGFFFQYL
jgi:hypothetical protein